MTFNRFFGEKVDHFHFDSAEKIRVSPIIVSKYWLSQFYFNVKYTYNLAHFYRQFIKTSNIWLHIMEMDRMELRDHGKMISDILRKNLLPKTQSLDVYYIRCRENLADVSEPQIKFPKKINKFHFHLPFDFSIETQ